MPSLQIVKRRISSVRTTQQITRAMNNIAASKLQIAKARLNAARPMFNEIRRVVENLTNSEEAADNVFIKKREVKNIAYLVITSDRGLCGGYNANISNAAFSVIKQNENEKIIAVGTKGAEFFRHRGKNVIKRYKGMSESVLYKDAEDLGKLLTTMYLSGEIDEAYVAYTQFETTLSYVPQIVKMLPIGSSSEEKQERSMMQYEPDVNTVLDYIVPLYLDTLLYGAMAESATCEQAACMVSMDSATNNAEDIIDDLTLAYNRIRQGAITQEISEIVGVTNIS